MTGIMYLIDSPYTDPSLNLALEEILMHREKGDYMLLYVNGDSVIIGKHQNIFREVNLSFVEKYNIPVLRRISGGGTVFHDTGNLNFSFILNSEKGKMVDFNRYMHPVILYIRALGIEVKKDKRHNLRIQGMKISGNAEHVYKQRILHHGTLLFSSRLHLLKNVLQPPPGTFRDKAINSEPSSVTNISNHLKKELSMQDFRSGLLTYCHNYFSNAIQKAGLPLPYEEIQKLAAEKYNSWDWNYGYSPDFTLTNEGLLQQKNYRVILQVKKGKIVSITLEGDRIEEFSYLCDMTRDMRYQKQEVWSVLSGPKVTSSSPELREEWLALLFPENPRL